MPQASPQLANISIIFSVHRTLNCCHGVIAETNLQNVSKIKLIENLKNQKVTETKRIYTYIYKNNEKIPIKHVILTFASTKLPRSVKADNLECPSVPNLLCCFKCQQFGYSKTFFTCSLHGKVDHKNLNFEAAFCYVNYN